MRFFSKGRSPLRGRSPYGIRLNLEHLETRVVPYTTTGAAWPSPNLVTISFIPDGTPITGGTNSNLFSDMSSLGSTATWQAQFLKAAQVWAQQANINIAVVSDNGTSEGNGNYQQGDPGMGDIRIGGYNFQNSGVLALTNLPPSNTNFSAAGDIAINTGVTWKIGGMGGYDPFTVAVHEMGHALGLADSSQYVSNMYGTYEGKTLGLFTDDVQGIQAIYGARPADSSNSSFATATNLTSQLDPTAMSAVVNNQQLSTGTSADYFTVTAPSGTNSTAQFQVVTTGLSMMSPVITVYASNETTVLGSANGSGKYGTTLTVTVNNVTAGEQFYVKITGTGSPFNDGAYGMAVNFGTGTMPAVTIPNTELLDGNPSQDISGGLDELAPSTLATQQAVAALNAAPAYTPVVATATPVQAPVSSFSTAAATIPTTVPTTPAFTIGASDGSALGTPETITAPAVDNGAAAPAAPVVPASGSTAPTSPAAPADIKSSARPQQEACDRVFADAAAVDRLQLVDAPVANAPAADVAAPVVTDDADSDTGAAQAVFLLPAVVFVSYQLDRRERDRSWSIGNRA